MRDSFQLWPQQRRLNKLTAFYVNLQPDSTGVLRL